MSKEVKVWKEKARAAWDERDKLYTDTRIKQFESHFYNDMDREDGNSKSPVLTVNLIATMMRRLIAQIYFRNPHVVVRSLDRVGEAKAPIITRLWNAKIARSDIKAQERMTIQDALSVGWGVMKIGYETEFAVDPAAKFVSENESQLTEQDTPAEQNIISPGSPYWLRVHPADVALQPGKRDVISADWAVERYYRDLKSLKKDSRFKNTSNLKPDWAMSSSTHGSQAAYTDWLADSESRAKEDLVLLYEFRDLVSGKMMVCAANQSEKWLYNEVDEITRLTERLPFHFLIFNPLTQSPYGASTIDFLDQLQLEFNDIRTQDMHQRRISIMRLLVSKGIMDEEAKENMTKEEVGAVVEIDGAITDDRVRMFTPHQGFDMGIAAEGVRRDMREVAGLGRAQQGENVQGRHTAAEITEVARAFNVMVSDNRSAVSDHFLKLISDAHRLISGTATVDGFWTDERIIDMYDQMGVRKDVPFRGTDLVGSFNFDIDVESSPPLTSQQLQGERVGVFSALQGNPRINQNYLLNWVAEVFEGVDVDRLIIPEERYIQAQQQTLEAGQQAEDAGRQKDEASASNKRQDERDTKLGLAAIGSATKPTPTKQKAPTKGKK